MRKCILFLAGRYYARDFVFYRRLARGCFKVAVDGGFRFFARSGLVPDLLIGDLDSLARKPRRLSRRTEVIVHPVDKDKTDLELALDYCLERGALRVDIVQPGLGEPDHFLANLFLLTRAVGFAHQRRPRIRLVGPDYEAHFISDRRVRFLQARGSVVSVIPLSGSIVLTCRGTAFDVNRARIKRGRTRPTRNRITGQAATFEVSGQAFLVRVFPKG